MPGGGTPSPAGDKVGCYRGKGSFGLKHHQSRGSGSTGQVRAPRTAAAEKKGCSLHLQGLRRIGTRFQEVEGEVLLPGVSSRR